MNRLNEPLGKDITKKQIDEIIMEAFMENARDLNLRYASWMEKYFYDSPKPEELLPGYLLTAVCTAYAAAMDSMEMVLYKLFGIEDTPAAGKQDEHTEQMM